MSLNTKLSIQLPQFEGPLALLLYLIRKEEMDIFDIEIHKITAQYLEYMKLMRELDLELAGDFITMAATLIQIKSQMLLPQYNEQGEIVENEDPRKELVQRLLEYQKYQEAAKTLYDRPLLGRDTWARGVREKLELEDEGILLEDNALYSLISSYRKALKTMKKAVHQVAHKLQSIANRILEIKDRLIVGQKVAMSDLINAVEEKHRQVLITFLSGLELGKMGFVNLYQSDVYREIYFEAKKPVEADAVSRVEEYDNLYSEKQAENLIEVSQEIREAFDSADEEPTLPLVAIDEETAEDNAYILDEDVATDEDIELAEKELDSNDEGVLT